MTGKERKEMLEKLPKEQQEWLKKHRPWLFEDEDPAVKILLEWLRLPPKRREKDDEH